MRMQTRRSLVDRLVDAPGWLLRAFLEGCAAYALSMHAPLVDPDEVRDLLPVRREPARAENPDHAAAPDREPLRTPVASFDELQSAASMSDPGWSWWLDAGGRRSGEAVNVKLAPEDILDDFIRRQRAGPVAERRMP